MDIGTCVYLNDINDLPQKFQTLRDGGFCSCQLLSGSERHLHSGLVTREPGQAIRLCVSVPLGDVTLDL